MVIGDARADGHVQRQKRTPRRQAIDQRIAIVADAYGDTLGRVHPDT